MLERQRRRAVEEHLRRRRLAVRDEAAGAARDEQRARRPRSGGLEGRRHDGAARVEHLDEADRRPRDAAPLLRAPWTLLLLLLLLHAREREDLPLAVRERRLDHVPRARQTHEPRRAVEPADERPIGVAQVVDIGGADARHHRRRRRLHDLVGVRAPRPRDALHVEGADDAAAPCRAVGVPHLERAHAVGAHVCKQAVARRSARPLRAQRRAVAQHESAQQRGVVLARRVRDVDGAAADGARRRVQRSHLVPRVEHVPVGQADLAQEERVVRDVDEVHRVRVRAARVEVVGRARDARRLVVVEVLRRVAHAVDAV